MCSAALTLTCLSAAWCWTHSVLTYQSLFTENSSLLLLELRFMGMVTLKQNSKFEGETINKKKKKRAQGKCRFGRVRCGFVTMRDPLHMTLIWSIVNIKSLISAALITPTIQFPPNIGEVLEALAVHYKGSAAELMQDRCRIHAWWGGNNGGLIYSVESEKPGGRKKRRRRRIWGFCVFLCLTRVSRPVWEKGQIWTQSESHYLNLKTSW